MLKDCCASAVNFFLRGIASQQLRSQPIRLLDYRQGFGETTHVIGNGYHILLSILFNNYGGTWKWNATFRDGAFQYHGGRFLGRIAFLITQLLPLAVAIKTTWFQYLIQ